MEAKSVIDIFTILVYKQIMNASSTGPSVARSVGFATMTGSLMAATRALCCCADATSRTAGSTMNDLCLPSGEPGLLGVSPRRARVKVSRVFRKQA
jgi:hypothetical protein